MYQICLAKKSGFKRMARQTCEIVKKFKVNWLFWGIRMLTALSKLDLYDLVSLRQVMTAGGKASRDTLAVVRKKLPSAFVFHSYGEAKSDRRDEPGEMCVKMTCTMIGYYNNASATSEAIDDEGWLLTGDLGYYTESGEIGIVDRIKEFIKFREHKYSPFELEELLLKHPDVMDAAVVPVPNEADFEHPMAFVRKVSDSQVTEEEIMEYSCVLGDNKKLRGSVKFLEKMPTTVTEKIDRRRLKELAKNYVVQ